MRKSKFLFGLILCIAGGLMSCNEDYLDQTVITDLNEDIIFADSTYATGFLTDIYSDIGFDTDLDRFDQVGGLQVACDEAEYKQVSKITTGASFATGTITPVTVTKDVWETCYKRIRACNKFLQKIEVTPMMESTKRQYKAECRVLRAWYYFILVRHYGGVPLIGDDIYELDDDIKSTRDTYADCINYIDSEINSVLSEHVLRPRTSGRLNGRASEGWCYGLLSRMWLYAASPLFNSDERFGTADTQDLLNFPTYDKERWKKAIDASLQVITSSGDYRLFEYHYDGHDLNQEEPGWGYYGIWFDFDYFTDTDYGDFHYPDGAYQESIVEKKAATGYHVLQILCPVTCGGNGAAGYPYSNLVDAYPMIDGKPIGEGKYTYDPLQPALNRDPRFKNSISYNGCTQRSGDNMYSPVYTFMGDGATQDAVHSGTPTGYYIRKFVKRDCAGNYWAAPYEFRPLMRFAEILLNYAEAVNEYYGPDHVETLGSEEMSPYQVLKLIRRRAGIQAGDDGMFGLKANMTQEEMREAIRLERYIELAFEGFRFFDVRRWKIVEQTENVPMMGFEIKRTGTAFSYRPFEVRRHIFRPAMYFFPIPYDETVKQPDLKQNPYY